jgi:hypothetical protein
MGPEDSEQKGRLHAKCKDYSNIIYYRNTPQIFHYSPGCQRWVSTHTHTHTHTYTHTHTHTQCGDVTKDL